MRPAQLDATRIRGLRRYFPLLLGLLVAVVVSKVWYQFGRPFISHDDWDFLLPVNPLRRDQMLDRVLSEGRWLNYAWWRGLGHLLTPVTAVLLFGLAYLTLVARLAWQWAPGWLSLPVVVALFSAPMISELFLWPAALGPSMLVTAIAALTLTRCAREPRTLWTWLVLATFLTFISYPPATMVIFVIVTIELIDRSLRELTWVTVVFGLTYGVSTLFVFTLNKIAFGTFGIEALRWRHPNPLHDLGDLGQNLRTVIDGLRGLFDMFTIPIVLGMIGVVACLVLPGLRARGIRLTLIIVVLLGLQSATTIVSGVYTPARSNVWIWFLVVIPFIWLAREQAVRRAARVGAVVALVLVGAWGLRYWQHTIDESQDRRARFQVVEDRIVAAVREDPQSRVVLTGSEADWADSRFSQEVMYLSEKALADHGIVVSTCRPPGCRFYHRPSVVARLDAGRRVIRLKGYILVLPSSAGR